MGYLNTKNILYMVVLLLVMVATYAYTLNFERTNSIYTNVNGYNESIR